MSRPEDRDPGRVPGLEDLFMDRTAPEGLEDRVVDALRADGWGGPGREADGGAADERGLRPGGTHAAGRSRSRTWLRASGALAAGLALFALGWGTGRTAPAAQDVPTHMLLLWEDSSFRAEETPGAHAEAYGAWLQEVAAQGRLIDGAELGPPRVYVGPGGTGSAGAESGRATPRLPIDPTGDSAAVAPHIGGYFLLRAEDLQAALRLVEGHPHLANGGWIEVAELVQR